MLPELQMWLLCRRALDVVALLAGLAPVEPLQGEKDQQRDEDERHLVPPTLVGQHDGRGCHQNNAIGSIVVRSDQRLRRGCVPH